MTGIFGDINHDILKVKLMGGGGVEGHRAAVRSAAMDNAGYASMPPTDSRAFSGR